MATSPNDISDVDLGWLWAQLAVERRFRRRAQPADSRLQGHAVVVGGGTAGYLTALTLITHCPRLRVSLVESPGIPIIGVGEATVPGILPFLHNWLAIDVAELYREVQPTWKLGIRFEWGKPAPYYFNAPFDWARDSGGILGSLQFTGSVNDMTFGSMLMSGDRVPIVRNGATLHSALQQVPIAYHLDNARFVAALKNIALARGVTYVPGTVLDVRRRGSAVGEIAAILLEHGVEIAGDLFVDCSGFRGRLITQVMGAQAVTYNSSLFTNKAIVFELPHHGLIKPYTTATTMRSGWTWNIPQKDCDHCGYVFSDEFASDDEAVKEATERFGAFLKDPRAVSFRSGRIDRPWIGNVVAIGNAQGFVEPLESTALMMITISLQLLIELLGREDELSELSDLYNRATCQLWDGLRWFLSIHYKYNKQVDSEFWESARRDTDIAGAEDILRIFRQRSPLRFRSRSLRVAVDRLEPFFYGLAGVDTILLGQGVTDDVMPSTEHEAQWRERKERLMTLVTHCLTMTEVLQTDDLFDRIQPLVSAVPRMRPARSISASDSSSPWW
jgi:tryptophan halogenase